MTWIDELVPSQRAQQRHASQSFPQRQFLVYKRGHELHLDRSSSTIIKWLLTIKDHLWRTPQHPTNGAAVRNVHEWCTKEQCHIGR